MGGRLKKLIINRCEHCYHCDIQKMRCLKSRKDLLDLNVIPVWCILDFGVQQHRTHSKDRVFSIKESLRDLFSFNLRKTMKEKDLAVSDVARKLGVTDYSVRNWRDGVLPRDEHLYSLSLLLDLKYQDFFKEVNIEHSN